MGIDEKVMQAERDKILAEYQKALAQSISPEYLRSLAGYGQLPGLNQMPIGSSQYNNSVTTQVSQPKISLTNEEKVEIMSRLTKAWVQMPLDYGFVEAIWHITAPLSSRMIDDRKLAELFEKHVEGARRIALQRRFEEAMDKMKRTIDGNPSVAEELMNRFAELMK